MRIRDETESSPSSAVRFSSVYA